MCPVQKHPQTLAKLCSRVICLQVRFHLVLIHAITRPLCSSAPCSSGGPPLFHLQLRKEQVGSSDLSKTTQLISKFALGFSEFRVWR